MSKIFSNNKFPFKYLFFVCCLMFLSSFVVGLYDAKDWLGKTFPGFLFYSNRIVAEENLAEWTGSKNGIKSFDQIIFVDGFKVSNSTEIYDYVSSLDLNKKVKYKILRGGDLIDLEVPTMVFSFKVFLSIFAGFYFFALIFFAAGSIVYYFKPNDIQSKVFFLFCFFFSLWFISNFDSHTNYIFDIETPVWMSVSPFFIILSLVFPSEKAIYKKKGKQIIIFSLFLSLILFFLRMRVYGNI